MKIPALFRSIAVGLLLSVAWAALAPQLRAATPAGAPVDGAREVSLNPVLEWPAVEGATAYDVFFGAGDAPAFQGRVTRPRFVLETLRPGTTYRWRVDAVTADGVRAGSGQGFTTVAKPTPEEALLWATRIARSVRALWTPQTLGGFNYTQGMVAEGLCLIGARAGRPDDVAFAQAWLDRFVGTDGTLDPKEYPPKLYSLDRVRPGPALLLTYERTGDERYRKAMKELIHQLEEQPRTSEGGYWHRSTYPNQMWLDGIYMADVFAVRYGAKFGEPKLFDEAVHQITLIHRHTHDPRTGLYFHGWDETKTRPWADKVTGTSPEIWARAVGWYAMAMVDVLDALPTGHPGRAQVLPLFRDLCAALLKVQDRDTAGWYQIMDKPTGPKNYIESSCSLMFAYAFLRGAQGGWLPPEYREHGRRALRGMLNHKIDVKSDGTMDIRDTVIVGPLGGSGGFYDSYMKDRIVTNDQKAIGTFMFLSLVLADDAVTK
jgi:unsaturated rhamnogalacturonyl hydrolase